MTIQISIIGLGQIGASVGLALGQYPDLVQRVGHDRDINNAQRAEKLGALDRVSMNLISAVREADLVLLSLPIDQIRETLELIAQDLKENAVVMDTGPVKEVVAAWAAELLPPERFYVGLTPVLNPDYLHEHASGINAAHSDLFRKGLIAITAPPRTPSDAIKLAADLTRLLGADPLFFDPIEIDSLMAATHILPQLVAAALLNATVDQPGWREGRKVAGRAYSEVTNPVVLLSEPKAVTSEASLNRDHVLRWLDSLISSLHGMRADLVEQNLSGLEQRLLRARLSRETWWYQRQSADWQSIELSSDQKAPRSGGLGTEVKSGSEGLGRLLGLAPKSRHSRKH